MLCIICVCVFRFGHAKRRHRPVMGVKREQIRRRAARLIYTLRHITPIVHFQFFFHSHYIILLVMWSSSAKSVHRFTEKRNASWPPCEWRVTRYRKLTKEYLCISAGFEPAVEADLWWFFKWFCKSLKILYQLCGHVNWKHLGGDE